MEVYFQPLLSGLLASAPAIVAWTVAVVLAAIMLGRGGARAERLLLTGACLMLLASILAIPASVLGIWLHIDREMTSVQTASWLSIYGLGRGIISLAGIVCLVYAFWLKFRAGK